MADVSRVPAVVPFPVDPDASYRLVIWSDSHAPVSRLIAPATQGAEVALAPGRRVSARPVDEDQNPLPESTLTVEYKIEGLRETIRRKSKSGTVALIQGIPAAPVEWSLSAPARSGRVAAASLVEGDLDLGQIVLAAARPLEVQVSNGNREPVSDAAVAVPGVAIVRTNPSGRASFEALPREDLGLVVRAAGYLPESVTVPAELKAVSVVVRRGAGVRARLLDPDGRTPAIARVELINNGATRLLEAETQPELLIAGLDRGEVRIRISAEGTGTHDTGTVRLSENQIIDLGIISLPRGLLITGKAIDETGAPVVGATVRTLNLGGATPALAHVLGNYADARTDDEGNFRVAGLSPGPQILIFKAQGFATLVHPQLTLDASVPERLLDQVVLVRGARVEIDCRPRPRCGTQAVMLIAGTDFPFIDVSSPLADGAAVLHAVPPGDYILRLLRSQQVVHERSVSIPRGKDSVALAIELPAVRVRGAVRVGGRPAREGSLLFVRSVKSNAVPMVVRQQTEHGATLGRELVGTFGSGSSATIDREGRYELEDLDPAVYDVTFRDAGAGTAAIQVVVDQRQEQTLNLTFEGATIAGQVVDREGRGTAARLEVVDGRQVQHTSSSDFDGRFRLSGIAAGNVVVTATSSSRTGEARIDTSRTEASAIIVRLDRDRAEFALTITDAGGNPLTGALAFLLTSQGVRTASTDREGKAAFREDASAVLAVAAHQPGRAWAFGRAGQQRLALSDRTTSLTIQSGRSGSLQVMTQEGFALHLILPVTGQSLMVSPASPLTIPGLPPGSYIISHAGSVRTVTLRPGEPAAATFD
jgi:hypothetical protein